MQLYNHRIVKCSLAFQSVQYHLKSWWIADEIESKLLQQFCLFSFFSFTFVGALRYFSVEKILKIPPTVKYSSNYFKGFFQPSRILPTVKKYSSNHQRFFQPSKILPTVREKKIRIAVMRETFSHDAVKSLKYNIISCTFTYWALCIF